MDRALRDLEDIYREIGAESSEAAQRWFNGLAAAIQSLENHPGRGTITPESDLHRQLRYGRRPHVYRITYQTEDHNHAVNVMHIRHGARREFDPSRED